MPLIKVNCAAIPETLLESELFGHVRGAFTGATTTKKGKFALADGGTIFLDEIGTMNTTLQAKLLRVLQEREIEPLGSERTDKIDVRVIAATNRDLRQMVADGKFQEDLFYRLNVIPIEIPPLRERRDDIPALVEHFVVKHSHRIGRRIEKLEDGVLTSLQQYDWPGNVRELENTIERAVVLSPGPVVAARAISVIGAITAQPASVPSLKLRQNIEWVERETIRREPEEHPCHARYSGDVHQQRQPAAQHDVESASGAYGLSGNQFGGSDQRRPDEADGQHGLEPRSVRLPRSRPVGGRRLTGEYYD